MPWQGSASVPFVISAPSPRLRVSLNLETNATVIAPVATLDLAGTVLDFAGAPAAANMTTQTLRPLLIPHVANVTPPRAYVSSGLQSWRLVVMTHPANGHALKLVCCKGPCPGQPSNSTDRRGAADADWAPRVRRNQIGGGSAPPRSSTDTGGEAPSFTTLLYDTTVDPFDMEDVSSSCECRRGRRRPPSHHFYTVFALVFFFADPHAVTVMKQLLPNGWCGSVSAGGKRGIPFAS